MASLSFEHEQTAFQQYYRGNYQALRDAEAQFRTLVASLLAQVGSFAEVPNVMSRVKAEFECISKFQRKYQTELEKQQTPYEIKDYVTDLIGLRVTCLYESEIAEVARVLTENFTSLSVTDKIAKLESTDDAFGYRGLHLDLAVNNARRGLPEYGKYRDFQFEVQIRTVIQDGWSILDHKMKYKRAIPTALKRRINVLAALFELADHEFLAIQEATLLLEQRAREQVPADGVGASVSTEPSKVDIDEPYLNVFQFLQIASSQFPHYQFRSDKADEFVHEIVRWKPDLTASAFSTILTNYLPVVNRYIERNRLQRPFYLNPFTRMRHALFVSDRATFRWILYDLQRRPFVEWLDTDNLAAADGAPSPSSEEGRVRALVRDSMDNYRRGRYMEGAALAEQALHIHPSYGGAWRSLATNLSQIGEHERAREAWRTVDRLSSVDSINYDATSSAALGAVRSDWASVQSWDQLVTALGREGRGREAIGEAQAMVKLHPEAHASVLSVVERLVSEYPTEIGALLTDMLAAAPHDPHYGHLLGLSLRKAGQDRDAIPYLRAACEVMPNNANYWYCLGRALEDSGNRVDACVAFQRSVGAQSPPHRKAQERLTMLCAEQ